MKNIYTLILALIILVPSLSLAHPGRTDQYGCHTCKTNCEKWGLSYGEYHCHNSKGLPQPQEPIKSTYGENGTGYTTPAPKYKEPIKIPVKKIEIPKKVENKVIIPTEQSIKVENKIIEPKIQKQDNWLKRLFNFLFGG
jgi:hypothetical protein